MATQPRKATKMAASKAATANATASGTKPKGAFILDPAELATLSSARGRKATDSVYLDEVKHALENPTAFDKDGNVVIGDVHGIQLTESLKASWVGPQLRKAAKQLNIDSKRFSVLDRSTSKNDEHPFGFVAYWVKPEPKAGEHVQD